MRLSPTEFNVLRLLIAHPGYVLTHRHILREMRGREMRGDGGEDDLQYLRVYMRLLRRKLEPDPAQPRYILTEPRIGYRLLCDS